MKTRLPTTCTANGPPPEAAARLYVGEVMHARLKPVGHRFTYRVANLLVDLDRLEEAGRACPLFSVGRFNLFSFRPADHGPRDGGSLRAHIDALCDDGGIERPERVLLLCYPRVLGFVFNPISVYFGLDRTGRVTVLVYEVRNTFGESHTYVAAVEDGQADDSGIRQARRKRFFVSPFMDMDQRYQFHVLPRAKPSGCASWNGTRRDRRWRRASWARRKRSRRVRSSRCSSACPFTP